jgi:hypothetical protein
MASRSRSQAFELLIPRSYDCSYWLTISRTELGTHKQPNQLKQCKAVFRPRLHGTGNMAFCSGAGIKLTGAAALALRLAGTNSYLRYCRRAGQHGAIVRL